MSQPGMQQLDITVTVNGRDRAQEFPGATRHLTIGSLASNHILLQQPGVEPIHGILEISEDGTMRLTDLGTLQGILVNGQRVNVDCPISVGDTIDIAGACVKVTGFIPAVPGQDDLSIRKRDTLTTDRDKPKTVRQRLFKPESSGKGPYLEVVAYWGNTVLNVDHFHQDIKGFESVTIGDPSKAHFISGGSDRFKQATLAELDGDRSSLRLVKGMKARIRQDGKLKKVKGNQILSLGLNDYAQIEYGAVRYFLHYASQPNVKMPPPPKANPLHTMITIAMAIMYASVLGVVALVAPIESKPFVFTPPEYDGPILTIEKPVEKKEVILREIRKPEPVKRVVERKVKPVDPVKQPEKNIRVEEKKITPIKPPEKKEAVKIALTKPTVKPVTRPTQPTNNTVRSNQPPRPNSSVANSQLNRNANSSGVKTFNGIKPLASGTKGPPDPRGDRGAGKPGNNVAGTPGSARGQGKPNLGVEGGKLNRNGMINLDALSSTGLTRKLDLSGGIRTRLPSGGGGGIQGGRLDGRHGLDGYKGGTSLALRGDQGDGIMNGGGNDFGGQNNRLDGLRSGGGPGGTRVAADVQVFNPVGGVPPDISQDVAMVIRSNLNQIRHCYTQTLQYAPAVTGKMLVAFTIMQNGRVSNARIQSSTISDTRMQACVTRVVTRWKFKPPPAALGTVNITYPFHFKPM